MKIRAWYTGGRIFDVTSVEEWKALPEGGALLFLVYGDGHRYRVNGGDWYWLEDGQVKKIASREWGTWQPRPDVACLDCLKQGAGISDGVFAEIVADSNMRTEF